MSVPSVALNEATPAGGDKIREGDDRLREFKTQVREIGAKDHKYDSSGQDGDMGKHNQISFLESADLPAGTEGKAILGTQPDGDSGESELFFVDENNTDVQITKDGAVLGVPSGCILMWSGAITAIPTGWVICDGNNSTPNLTDRFVIHADADAAGTNDVGDTGGVKTHTLLTAEMPAHTHSYTASGHPGAGSHQPGDTYAVGYTTGSKGGGGAHTNRDKFYALAYIMKT